MGPTLSSLVNFWCSVVTSVTLSCNLRNFEKRKEKKKSEEFLVSNKKINKKSKIIGKYQQKNEKNHDFFSLN